LEKKEKSFWKKKGEILKKKDEKKQKSKKKGEKCTIDYYYNPQCIRCG